MIDRKIAPVVLKESDEYPVVTLIGPRQSGKTTLVKNLFASHIYVNLENPEIRSLAISDPKTFLRQYPHPVVFDEVQRVPELLSWIQVLVDEGVAPGSFILTGSHQLRLREAITQSLAGRTSLLTLLPLSIEELKGEGGSSDKDEYMHRGFLPRIYGEKTSVLSTYRNYFRTYIERDVRLLINLKNVIQFENFIKILAGRVGQVVNLNSLANDVGVTGTTLNDWLSILEASFIIFRLPPYYNNFGKRLIKSPKLYFTEPGLAAWLLGIESPEQVSRDPLHGQLFENMIVMEACKSRFNQGLESNLYFWRDNNRNEIDLLFERQRRLHPIEIKSSRTWNSAFLKNIRHFSKTISAAEKGTVIYGGEENIDFDDCKACSYASPELFLN
jgi:predicted AAA+ superfamily ATPase